MDARGSELRLGMLGPDAGQLGGLGNAGIDAERLGVPQEARTARHDAGGLENTIGDVNCTVAARKHVQGVGNATNAVGDAGNGVGWCVSSVTLWWLRVLNREHRI